jgi:CRP/FNR family transcriptional regulator, cyclic AMP receptor protein
MIDPRQRRWRAHPVKQPQYSLESVALFRDLPAEILKRVKSRCLSRRYGPREAIVGHLDTSDEVFFLLTGSARVTIRSVDGKAVTFRELGPGGMFGEYTKRTQRKIARAVISATYAKAPIPYSRSPNARGILSRS